VATIEVMKIVETGLARTVATEEAAEETSGVTGVHPAVAAGEAKRMLKPDPVKRSYFLTTTSPSSSTAQIPLSSTSSTRVLRWPQDTKNKPPTNALSRQLRRRTGSLQDTEPT
jgi:hypothetical protein